MKLRVLVCDPMDEKAIAILRKECDVDVLGKNETVESPHIDGSLYSAFVVRSRTKVTRQVLERMSALRVIGRAGVGVDNIDVEAATSRGVAIVTSPSGNTFSVAQHTIALLFAHFSNIAVASRFMREGRWRKDLVGQEARGKTIGVVGLGKIGSEVARLARNVGMIVLGHDPYASEDRVRALGVTLVPFEDLLSRSDVVSCHVPFSEATRGIIGERELALMKRDAFLINTARGGVVDEEALLRALDEGRIGGAGIDVFSQEPPKENNEMLRRLIASEKVIATPHIAGSTVQAQERVGEEVANGVIAVLEGRIPSNCYNVPFAVGDSENIALSFIDVAKLLGHLALQLSGGRIERVQCRFEGQIVEHDTRILCAAVLTGILKDVVASPVTIVNALSVAKSRGIIVAEEKQSGGTKSSMTIFCGQGDDSLSLSALHDEEGIKLIAINGYSLSIRKPDRESHILFIGHRDQPGMVGRIGTILGEANINIAAMDVGRESVRGDAVMVLVLDDSVPSDILVRIRELQANGSNVIRFVKYATF